MSLHQYKGDRGGRGERTNPPPFQKEWRNPMPDDPRVDPLLPVSAKDFNYLNRNFKVENLQQCEDRMRMLHEQNLQLVQKLERIANRVEDLARSGGIYNSARNYDGYYNGQNNGYTARYWDGPPSASYMESVRDSERRNIDRMRYDLPPRHPRSNLYEDRTNTDASDEKDGKKTS